MDETLRIILKIIGLIIVFVGVIFIFDARHLGQKWFGFGDRNEAAKTLKIIGFIGAIIGGIITALVSFLGH